MSKPQIEKKTKASGGRKFLAALGIFLVTIGLFLAAFGISFKLLMLPRDNKKEGFTEVEQLQIENSRLEEENRKLEEENKILKGNRSESSSSSSSRSSIDEDDE